MAKLNKNAADQLMDYMGVALNPAQMDQLAEVLAGAFCAELESIGWARNIDDADAKLDGLMEGAVNLVHIATALKKLNYYKIANNGEPLKITLPDFSGMEE
jgi:hypothetical protein